MKGTILIIEDEIELGELMSMYLSKEGFTVHLAQVPRMAKLN
jgi:DNA-binding response OmpR family regulator